jgi:hypothetical protein
MPSNLAGGLNLGHLGACVVRVAKLDTDCSPLGGNNTGWVTTGLVTLTATPDIEEGTVFEPKTACGTIAYTYERADVVKRWNLTGEFVFFDPEGAEVMFGGQTILGAAGGDFAGEVIGWAAPVSSATTVNNGVYLEIISQVSAEGAGDCITSGSGFPQYFGYVFGKVKMTPGERTFEDDFAVQSFTGKATNNPSLFDGPWNDYPGAGYMPNSAFMYFGYTAAEYAAILATAAAGYQDLPAGS